MKNSTTFTNTHTPELSIEELKKAIAMLEDAQNSKEELRKSLTKVIAFLARKTGYEVFESKYIPKDKIFIGVEELTPNNQ